MYEMLVCILPCHAGLGISCMECGPVSYHLPNWHMDFVYEMWGCILLHHAGLGFRV